MDRTKKIRAVERAAVTRTVAAVDAELAKEVPDPVELKTLLPNLETLLEKLNEYNETVFEHLLDGDANEEILIAEKISCEEYSKKIVRAKLRTELFLNPAVVEREFSPGGHGSERSLLRSSESSSHGYRLPKIEMKKFDGNLKEWLGFWAQFKKIHEDAEIHASDKYQYLIQSMVAGTRAKELVESYPQTAENYPKVIKALKERFGNEKLLMQVYVRELLRMVIENNMNKMKLSQMFDKLESHLRALESLGVTMEQTAIFLYPMVESSLPEDTLVAWQRSSLYLKDGTLENPPKNELNFLMEFLRQEVECEGRRALARSGFGITKVRKTDKTRRFDECDEDTPTAIGLYSGQSSCCIFCDKSHDSRLCFKAQRMSLEDKEAQIKKRNCCFRCLKPGHVSKRCKHPAILCHENLKNKKPDETKVENPEVNSGISNSSSGNVILQTLMVTVVGKSGRRRARAIIDSGSQRSYILKKTVAEIGLESFSGENLCHVLFGGSREFTQHKKYNIHLESLGGRFQCHLSVLDQDKICGRIPQVQFGSWMCELKKNKIFLSDLGQEAPDIELLIGADSYGKLLTGNSVQLSNGLTAVETLLGWTVMGEIYSDSDSVSMNVTNLSISSACVTELWNLETIGIEEPGEKKSKEEQEKMVMNHFVNTVSRCVDGRYSISLPWIGGVPNIPTNFAVAEKRLKSTTVKLLSKGMLGKYEEMFLAWEQEGIIEEVPIEFKDVPAHYLPHHAVIKPESLTTPIRPVFDASCKTGRFPSLNECLEKGPNLLELIPSVLLRFREKKVGVTSDIRKAFQMIEVNKEDRDYLRFLWWKDSSRTALKIYRHKRVVFGVNCSPFILAAVIKSHLDKIQDSRKSVAEQLLKSLYVDNCVTSVNNYEEYQSFMENSIQLMAEAKMELRQWECTVEQVSEVDCSSSERSGMFAISPDTTMASKDHLTSVLGLKWNKVKDSLRCVIEVSQLSCNLTKRIILSSIQRIYDPIGFLCPALLQPKLLLQQAWQSKIGWDENLPQKSETTFRKWYSKMNCLNEVEIPRWMTNSGIRQEWEIHTFVDASENAYAAAVFLKSGVGDNVCVQLLQAKSRLAPIKRMTIPRLELLSCVIGARLAKSVKSSLDLEQVETFFWTDSSTALAWIKRNDEWGTFVGRRVLEICLLTKPEEWRHVPGKSNPADLPSRGCCPSELLVSRWWEGPNWLKLSRQHWPCEKCIEDEDAIVKEKKKTPTCTVLAQLETPWYVKFSNFRKNVRFTGWILRFINNLKKGSEKLRNKELTLQEVMCAEKSLLRLVQMDTLVEKNGVVSGFMVEKDDFGLIRVKTRLNHGNDCEGFRFPILLPNSHPLVDQLIREVHSQNCHAGVQFLMCKMRENYWVIQGRRAIRKVIGKCVKCLRFTSKPTQVPMTFLPEDRVQLGKVFETVGVDLAGPLTLKGKQKCWIVLFTCAVYRCVHLELVTSLSTDSFLLALKRFVDRRGRPKTIYSDNGRNFVGAVNLFNELDWTRIERDFGVQQIRWKFSPPSAPWWGGFWERLIRSVKDILKRTLGRSCVTYEELLTHVCDAEVIINGRPLTFVTEDQSDLIPITPAMFLQDLPVSEIPEVDLVDSSDFENISRRRKAIREELKSRFRKEYLSLLVQRENKKRTRVFNVGDVVIVGVDNKKRLEWPLAVILELVPGRDGISRIAKVKTATGILVRPVQRLYPLEVSSSIEDRKFSKELKTAAEEMKEDCDQRQDVVTKKEEL